MEAGDTDRRALSKLDLAPEEATVSPPLDSPRPLTWEDLRSPGVVLGEHAGRFQPRLLPALAESYISRVRREGAETPDEIVRCVKYLLDQGFKD